VAVGAVGEGGIKVIVAQRAIFGDKNHAHELLAATGPRELFRKFPAIEADLPSDAPVGVRWEPFIRGWPSEEYYFFSRTTPDTGAKRAGMVWTQILALPLSETRMLEDLSPVFFELEKPWSAATPLVTCELISGRSGDDLRSTVPSPRVAAIADVLATGAPSSSPAALCGQEGFADLINELWRRMPSTFHCELAFGFSFTPVDLAHRKLHVVCFPLSVAERWRTYVRRIDHAVPSRTLSLPTAFILGVSTRQGVQEFIRQSGLASPTLRTLSSYVRAAEYWDKSTQLDFQGWCALAKDVAQLAPEVSQAVRAKQEIANALARLLETGGPDGVLSLRNLSVGAFGAGTERIADGVRAWFCSQLRNDSPLAQDELLQILRGLERAASAQWSTWVKEGILQALETATATVAKNCWSIWQKEECLFPMLAPGVPLSPSAELEWTHAAPVLMSESLGRAVANWCKGRQWWTCYVKVLLAGNHWENAAREYLGADGEETRLEPVRLLLSSTSQPRAISFAVSHDDERFRDCGADLCVGHPELFAQFDRRSEGWRDVLGRALAKAPKLLDKVPDGQALLFALLDSVLDGMGVEDIILEHFAATKFGDLSQYPQREKIFAQLSGDLRGRFLIATAKGWLIEYLRNPVPTPIIEPVLRETLMDQTLRGARFSPNQAGLLHGWSGTVQRHTRRNRGLVLGVGGCSSSFSRTLGKVASSGFGNPAQTKVLGNGYLASEEPW
jgi:hypothetical protein